MVYTVLVIDNEPMQRNFLISVLKEKLAYNAVGVTTAREAMSYIMTEQAPKPDLILFDVSTVENNAEFIASLKILAAQTPIVTLVKYADYEGAIATLHAGAQDFLSKPVAVERLSTTLRNIMLLSDARRDLEVLKRDRINSVNASHPNYTASKFGHNSPFSLIAEDGNIRRMSQLEAEAIRFAMQYYNGRMTEVARRLGIGRSTLYRKLSDLSIRQSEAA